MSYTKFDHLTLFKRKDLLILFNLYHYNKTKVVEDLFEIFISGIKQFLTIRHSFLW